MKRLHRWTNKRRNRQIRKIAAGQAAAIVNELVRRQSRSSAAPKLANVALAGNREKVVAALTDSIEASVQRLRMRG